MTKYNLTLSILLLVGLLLVSSGCPQSGTQQPKSGAVMPPSTVPGAGGSSSPPPQPVTNFKAATDFTYATFSGKSGKMSSYFGKPLVVNFWASW